MLRPLWIALALLTIIPMPAVASPTPREFGLSLLAYPLVGVVIGLPLAGLASFSTGWPVDLAAVGLVALWAGLTGGLHLDGLADMADAWIGGRGSRERILEILKDPRSGPAAISTLFFVLGIKCAAVKALLSQEAPLGLLLAPLLGRLAVVVLLLTTPYVRKAGMAWSLANNLPRRAGWGVVGFSCFLFIGSENTTVLFSLVISGMFLFIFRHMVMQRLQGVTGDILGAGCELVETVSLVVIALL